MSYKEKKIDYSVELMRIVGCFIVIGLLLSINPVINNQINFNRQLVNALCFDGATIFWLITGFFFVKGNYEKQLKRTIFGLWIPVIVLSILSYLIYDYSLLRSNKISEMNSILEYLSIFFKGILSFRNFAPSGSHFWFIYIYLFVVIISPLIKKIINLIESTNTGVILGFLSFALLCVNDYTNNQLLHLGTHYLAALVPATVFVIYGHFLYKNLNKIQNYKFINAISILVTYLLINLLRTYLIMNSYNVGVDSTLDNWFSSFSIISAVLIVLLVSVLYKQYKSKKIDDWIGSISKYTLYIYLIHPFIIKVLKKLSIYKSLVSTLNGTNFVFECLYIVVFSVLVFIASLFVCVIVDRIIRKFKK